MNNCIKKLLELLQSEGKEKYTTIKLIVDGEFVDEKYTMDTFKENLHDILSHIRDYKDLTDLGCIKCDPKIRPEYYVDRPYEKYNIFEFPKFLTNIITELYFGETKRYISGDYINLDILSIELQSNGYYTICIEDASIKKCGNRDSYTFNAIGNMFQGRHVCRCGNLIDAKDNYYIGEGYTCEECGAVYEY